MTPPLIEEAAEQESIIFTLTTRRGKQFNSMVQRQKDPLTGAMRDHIFMNVEDAIALGVEANDRVVVKNKTGEMEGRIFLAEVTRGTLQAHWPNYNAEVTIEPINLHKKTLSV